MNVRKRMCWCFGVFGGVLANLTCRLCGELLDFCHGTCWGAQEDQGLKDELEEFYKAVGRAEAEELLKDRQGGTFIIRPAKNCGLGTLSVVQDDRVFHLNIRRRGDGLVALGTEKDNEKCFQDVNGLINYYISNYLVLYSRGEKTLTLLLPYRDKAAV